MIQYGNIQKALGIDIAVSPKMARAIYRWSKMYVNEAPWLNEEVWSLNLPAAICSEMARLVTMESKISITGSDRADIISKSMGHFFTELSNYTEYACSVGGIVFKPYLSNKGIEIDTVKAGDFFPVEFDSAGDITAVIFPEYKRKGKELYTRLEYQALKGDTYIIANKAYVSRKANVKTDDIINLGQEISLESVEEWKELEPYVELHNADRTLFSYFKIPLANNIDTSSPLGVSVYSRAVHQIRDADEQYGATLWEYKSKETAIQAADEFFRKNRRGEVILPKGRERLYRAMGPGIMDSKGGPFFNAYSPEIRDQSFFNGYNKIIQKVEFNCGLAYGTLSDPQIVDKTAEEIKASKQRSYSFIESCQTSLQHALEDLVDAMAFWADRYGFDHPAQYRTTFVWDDSIVVDTEKERSTDRADVAMGAMQLWEYRMKWYGEDEETAKAAVMGDSGVIE